MNGHLLETLLARMGGGLRLCLKILVILAREADLDIVGVEECTLVGLLGRRVVAIRVGHDVVSLHVGLRRQAYVVHPVRLEGRLAEVGLEGGVRKPPGFPVELLEPFLPQFHLPVF